MAKKISKAEVAHVAHLARLELGSDELEHYSEELSRILDYIAQIQELDTSNFSVDFQSGRQKNVFREDVVGESLKISEVLSNAPEDEGNYFKMPKILES